MRSISRNLVILSVAATLGVAWSVHSIADKPVAIDTPAAPKTDPRLAGVWLMQSGVNQSKPIPDDQVEGSRMIVRADNMTVVDKAEDELYRCTYDFDASKTPNAITMVSTPLDQQKIADLEQSKVLGIYKIEGDELTLCYALPGAKRPTEFKSTKEGKTMLFKFKRPAEVDAEE